MAAWNAKIAALILSFAGSGRHAAASPTAHLHLTPLAPGGEVIHAVVREATLLHRGAEVFTYNADGVHVIAGAVDSFDSDASDELPGEGRARAVGAAVAHLRAIRQAYFSGAEAMFIHEASGSETQTRAASASCAPAIANAVDALPKDWALLLLGAAEPLLRRNGSVEGVHPEGNSDGGDERAVCGGGCAWPAVATAYALSRRGMRSLLSSFWPGGRVENAAKDGRYMAETARYAANDGRYMAETAENAAKDGGYAADTAAVVDLRWPSHPGPFDSCTFLGAPFPSMFAERSTVHVLKGGLELLQSTSKPTSDHAAQLAAAQSDDASDLPAISVAYAPGGAFMASNIDELLPQVFPGRRIVTRGFSWNHPNDQNLLELDASPVAADILVMSVLDCWGGGWDREWLWAMRGPATVLLVVNGEPANVDEKLLRYSDVYLTTVTAAQMLPAPPAQVLYYAEAAASFSSSRRQTATPVDLLRKGSPGFDAASVAAGKDRAVAYQYSNCKAGDRERFFDLLSERLPVYATGDCHGTLSNDSAMWQPERSRRAEWFNDRSVESMRRYHFVISAEALTLDGYITEKLVNPMLANAIPIYVGSKTAREYFNPKSYIDCGTYPSLERCADAVAAVNANETAYLEMLQQPWIARDRWAELFSWHKDVPGDASVRQLRSALQEARKRRTTKIRSSAG